MNKSDLIEALGKEIGLAKGRAEQVVQLFFDRMTQTLARGDRVEIRGFCSKKTTLLQMWQGIEGKG
jgi:integration host factor subunit beta